MTLGEFQRGGGERVRPHVIGRRVDEIAPHDDGADDPREAGRVDAFGRAKPRALGLWRDITGKAIARQKESQRRRFKVGGRVVEAIDARRQQRRELAREKRVALTRSLRLDAEQHALQRAVFAGLPAAIGRAFPRSRKPARRRARARTIPPHWLPNPPRRENQSGSPRAFLPPDRYRQPFRLLAISSPAPRIGTNAAPR